MTKAPDCLIDMLKDRILYEDNHLIIVNKLPGEIVQGDKTGDVSLADDVKAFLKEKYNKPGSVFLGIPHRLDRPTSGIVIYCKTSKALERMNQAFRENRVEKHYWAVTDHGLPQKIGRLEHYIFRDSSRNKSFAYKTEKPNTRKAVLEFNELAVSEHYTLLDITLITGRHHQIRSQLAARGVHIKGDLKYGFPRSNEDGGICLHSRTAVFEHPVTKQTIKVTAPVPDSKIWCYFEDILKK